MGIGAELTLILLAILLNGFFAASEIALVSARISRLASLQSAGASLAMRLKESPETFLATVQIGITLVGTLASAVGGATGVEALTPVFRDLGLGQAAQPLALGLVVVVLTYLSLVLGELAPKAIALQNPERLAGTVARPIYALSRVSAGLVRVLTASTNAVLRLMGLGTATESPFISEEEVRYLVREGAAKGIFEKTEEELVHNVFEFADTTVREVMVPRPNIRGIDVATPPAEVPRTVAAIGHSRIPVTVRDQRPISSRDRPRNARSLGEALSSLASVWKYHVRNVRPQFLSIQTPTRPPTVGELSFSFQPGTSDSNRCRNPPYKSKNTCSGCSAPASLGHIGAPAATSSATTVTAIADERIGVPFRLRGLGFRGTALAVQRA